MTKYFPHITKQDAILFSQEVKKYMKEGNLNYVTQELVKNEGYQLFSALMALASASNDLQGAMGALVSFCGIMRRKFEEIELEENLSYTCEEIKDLPIDIFNVAKDGFQIHTKLTDGIDNILLRIDIRTPYHGVNLNFEFPVENILKHFLDFEEDDDFTLDA